MLTPGNEKHVQPVSGKGGKGHIQCCSADIIWSMVMTHGCMIEMEEVTPLDILN